MLHCGNVENCEDTSAGMVERGKINWKGRTYCVARAPNDVSYKINTHIPDISIHYFLRGVAVWPQWTRSRRNRGDFTIQCRWPRAPYRCYSGFWTSYPPRPNPPVNMDPPPSKSASEYGHHPPPPIKLSFWAAFVLYLVIIIFLGGWNPRRIIFPPDKWVAWLAKLFCQSNKSRKTSPLPRFLGKDPSEWWEWSPATLLSTL